MDTSVIRTDLFGKRGVAIRGGQLYFGLGTIIIIFFFFGKTHFVKCVCRAAFY